MEIKTRTRVVFVEAPLVSGYRKSVFALLQLAHYVTSTRRLCPTKYNATLNTWPIYRHNHTQLILVNETYSWVCWLAVKICVF